MYEELRATISHDVLVGRRNQNRTLKVGCCLHYSSILKYNNGNSVLNRTWFSPALLNDLNVSPGAIIRPGAPRGANHAAPSKPTPPRCCCCGRRAEPLTVIERSSGFLASTERVLALGSEALLRAHAADGKLAKPAHLDLPATRLNMVGDEPLYGLCF